MFFTDCQDTSCLYNTFSSYVPYIATGLGVAATASLLGPLILPAAMVEASVFGVGIESVIAAGSMAI